MCTAHGDDYENGDDNGDGVNGDDNMVMIIYDSVNNGDADNEGGEGSESGRLGGGGAESGDVWERFLFCSCQSLQAATNGPFVCVCVCVCVCVVIQSVSLSGL